MTDTPQGLSNAPISTITKSPSPASGSLGNKHLLSLTGEAYHQPDPMRGRIVAEGTPEAKAMQANLEKQIAEAKALRNGTLPEEPSKKLKLSPGMRVFHTARKEFGVIAKKSEDNKRIEVIFPGGKKALVRIINLQRV